jgi:formylglycine-generating enzyme required for sulfatase activity
VKLVLIPAGTFLMASPKDDLNRSHEEGPQREVTISRPFYLGVCEVTRGQFAAFVKDAGYKTEAEKESTGHAWDGKKIAMIPGASWRKTGFEQADDHPVVNVSWNDAAAFCEWLGKKAGKRVSLPTDAQWEYACRAGTKTAYPWGEKPDGGKGWANAADQTHRKQFPQWPAFSWDDGYTFTAPVGKFQANAFGLYDMIGNAWEWCSDWFEVPSYGSGGTDKKTDPAGPASGSARVLRGGGWHHGHKECRSAFRDQYQPWYSFPSIGFRICVDPGKP